MTASRYLSDVSTPRGSLAGQLAAMGFADTARAQRLLAELSLAESGAEQNQINLTCRNINRNLLDVAAVIGEEPARCGMGRPKVT